MNNQKQTLTLPQRLVRSALATREYAVLILVCSCIIVECAILGVTQQYEAFTAPAGTVMLFGMSAAGLVVFAAELLKLPIAWASGTVTGGIRILLNFVVLGLCVLTATTVKDLTIREWDKALEPSRLATANAAEHRGQITALEEARTGLVAGQTQNHDTWNTRIAATNAEITTLQAQMSSEDGAHETKLNALTESVMSDIRKAELTAVIADRDRALAAVNQDIKDREADLQAAKENLAAENKKAREIYDQERLSVVEERARVQTVNENATRQAQEVFDAARSAYQTVETATDSTKATYDLAVKTENERLREEIADLRANDGAFFNISEKRTAAEAASALEITRLTKDWEEYKKSRPARPALVVPPLVAMPEFPAPVVPVVSVRLGELQALIDLKRLERSAAEGPFQGAINLIREASTKESSAQEQALIERRRALTAEHDESASQIQSQIGLLFDRKAKEEKQRGEIERSPADIARELQEIPGKIQVLQASVVQFENEAKRLATDTNPVRAAEGVISFFMPDATPERRVQVAFSVIPACVGILVAFLPALLLELAVQSLVEPPSERSRGRWRIWRNWSLGRRALRIERGKAAALAMQAQAQLKECEENFERRRLELDVRRAEFESDIVARNNLLIETTSASSAALDARRSVLDHEVEERSRVLQSELVDQVQAVTEQRDEAVNKQTVLYDSLQKAISDNHVLVTRIVVYDASPAGKS